jgi:hypothetical protein
MTAACVFLSGCGNPDIDNVKNGTLGNFKNLTIGNALDNYKYFTDTNWRFLETDNGKRIVEFKGIYDADKICKNTEFKQLVLVIQFTMRVQKGFDLSYFGMEGVLRDGKTKQISLDSRKTVKCLEKIYQNQNTLDLAAPLIIKLKLKSTKLLDKKPIVEILDNYKYFSSAKWSSEHYQWDKIAIFTGIVNQDQVRKFPGVKTMKFVYKPEDIYFIMKYSNGKEEKLSFCERVDVGTFQTILKDMAANKDMALILNPIYRLKNSYNYKLLMNSKLIKNPKAAVSKDKKFLILSFDYPVSKTDKENGAVKRQIYFWWKLDKNLRSHLQKCIVKIKYKDNRIVTQNQNRDYVFENVVNNNVIFQ